MCGEGGRGGPGRAEPGGSGGGAASRLTLCFVPRAAAPSPGPGQQGRQVHAGHFRGASLRYQGNPRSPPPSSPASFRPVRPPGPGCRRSGAAPHARAPAALTSTWPTLFPCAVCASSNELWGIFIQVGRSDSNSEESSAWKGRAGGRTDFRPESPGLGRGRHFPGGGGGRGRWVHMTQDGEPVGGRFHLGRAQGG